MKYVSLDIETTGLDFYSNQVIEVAMVVDDLSNPKPISKLPGWTVFVDWRTDLSWQWGALNMFKNRIDEYVNAQKLDVSNLVDGMLGFLAPQFINNFATRCKEADFVPETELIANKIVFAGKNLARFDLRFLENVPGSDRLMSVVHHRIIDPGSLYMQPSDTVVPSTSECMKRAKINGEVSHKAIEDCRDVIKLIRQFHDLPTT